jgi:hypothetical protein
MTYFQTVAAIVLISSTVSCAGGRSAGSYRYERSMTNAAAIKPAPTDSDRKIVEQDCSKPVELYGGNLRCK